MDTDKKVDELMTLLFSKDSEKDKVSELMDLIFEREFPFDNAAGGGGWVAAITSGNASEAEAMIFFGGFR